MKPVEFKEQTIVLAKDQPEYQPLPVYMNDTETISCWQFSWWDRVKVLFGFPLWVRQMNFGTPLQPQLPTFDFPFVRKS